MSASNYDELSHLSMLEIFRVEAENQTAILSSGLLELERGTDTARTFDTLMRAAHSLKGAARIVNFQLAVGLTHVMEDCFVSARQGKLTLRQPEIDALFRGVDLLSHLAKLTEAKLAAWEKEHASEMQRFLENLAKLGSAGATIQSQTAGPAQTSPNFGVQPPAKTPWKEPASLPSPLGQAALEATLNVIATRTPEAPERVVRLTAENLNRLLALAGESLVESRWLGPFAESLQRFQRQHAQLAKTLQALAQTFNREHLSGRAEEQLRGLSQDLSAGQQFLSDRVQELDLFDRRSAYLSQRLYLEVLRTRMRPFSEGVRRFPRMVRDLARTLGKEIKLEILGETTQVDRDILERLETPLAHVLRNAVDHGCEAPAQRERAGKPPQGTLLLEARHSAGMLLVTVTDDGPGVPLQRVRRAIVEKKLALPSVAERLTEAELLEFLFLPGFSLKESVTEISGRGVGLDIVQNMVKSVRGTVRLNSQTGRGLRLHLQLPLTLSVLRALLVEVAGEPYAIPLTQVAHALKLPRQQIESLEGRRHFHLGHRQIGLVTAHQVFGRAQADPSAQDLSIVVLGDRNARFGLVVDHFLGERELVVQPLDARLGKVKDISAAALMEDGSPVLIVDVEDLLRSVDQLIALGPPAMGQDDDRNSGSQRQKRVLAVDDSVTVRELERQLISSWGYLADVAVDGLDGWNAVRTGHYDLVITDVDMPRMDGIRLAALIKQDPALKSLPVIIVSYKDREEDRLRGLEAGADCYLAKAGFDQESLWQAVVELIGPPGA